MTKRIKKYIRRFSRRAASVILLSVLICSGFLFDCKVADADTFNPEDYADYVLMSESDAKKAYSNYINTMTPGGDELKIYCKAGVNDELKYKRYSVYFDDYMKFAYQASCDIMAVHSSREGYITYYRYYCAVREAHSSMTAGEYFEAMSKARDVAANNNYGSNYDKIKRVYKWVCDNVTYDYSYTQGSIYDAMIDGKSVCAGYAGTFQVIMEALGIECYINEGKVNGQDHAWNIVKLEGKYYFVDVTWGDTSKEYDKYLLFGTDIRTDITNLGVSSAAYNAAPTIEETKISSESSSETQTTRPVEKETIVVKPAETAISNGNIGTIGVVENDNETVGKTTEDSKEQEGAVQESRQQNQSSSQNKNILPGVVESSLNNSDESTINNSVENSKDDMSSVAEQEEKGRETSASPIVIIIVGVLVVAAGTFSYIKFIKKGK